MKKLFLEFLQTIIYIGKGKRRTRKGRAERL